MQYFVNQPLNIISTVSFVHEITIRRPVSVTVEEVFFGVNNVVNRVLGDLQAGNNLTICIHRDRRFQELFSRFTGFLGIRVAGV